MSLIEFLSFIFNLSYQPAYVSGFTQFDEEGYPVDDSYDDEEEDDDFLEEEEFDDEYEDDDEDEWE